VFFMNRVARVERLTHETQIMVELDLDGIGVVEVSTGVPFFDHMLAQLGKHGGLDLTVRAKGDTEIDAHHTVEDTSITLGQALREALGDKSGIARFGDALVPLDETLVQAAVDLSGRPYVVHHEPDRMAPLIGRYDTTLTRHIFESLAFSAGICLHVRVIARRIELGRPVLGICVGMQILFAAGVEHGVWTEGCGAWPGTVERLDADVL